MRVNIQALISLAEGKGWSIPMLAEKLGVDYSYLNRIINKERNGGSKLISGIYRLCKEEGKDVEEYIFFR
jgi:transcriptional regulator with XRE-family HTH domain